MAFQASNARPAYIQHTVAGGDPNADPLLTASLFPSGTLLLDQTTSALWINRRIAGTPAWVNIVAGGAPPTGSAGGDLAGTYPNPTVRDFHITGQTAGDVLYYNGTNWVRLAAPAPNSGYFLTNTGTAAAWANPDAAQIIGTATTTDATPTATITLPIPVNTAYMVRAITVGRQSDGSNRAGYQRLVCVYNTGAGATIQGAVQATFTQESDATWDCTYVVSGGDLIAQVTGVAATTITWTTRLVYAITPAL